jgi:hypothetical protein
MQPDEKGKFCNVCSKSVYDFSNKTDAYIHSVLKENQDKQVCGHFRKSQIDRPLQIKIPFTNLSGSVSRRNVFAIALFFVFGTFLFSCSNDHGQQVGEIGLLNVPDQKEEAMLGQMVAPLSVTAVQDTPLVVEGCESGIRGDVLMDVVNGGISYEPEELIEGKMIAEPIEPEPIIEIHPETMVAGGISYHHIETQVIEPVAEVSDSVAPNKTIAPLKENQLQLFPNPSTGEFNISYEVKQKGAVQADIYDMNGSLVRSLIKSQNQHTGKYVVPVNLSDLASGIYICKVIINGKEQHEEVVITK